MRSNNVIYRFTRDTINPVYNALADLVGIYMRYIKLCGNVAGANLTATLTPKCV